MPGESDIVNAALRRIGESPITTLADGTTAANAADDLYSELRDELLRSHPWNFATKRIKLAQSATAPAFEFDYAYPLPADWIRTISVTNNDAGYGTILYRMELIGTQRSILTSSDECYLRYVSQVTDPNLMPADFRATLALMIARDLSIALASSRTLRADLADEARSKLAQARSADGMGQFPELRPRGSWSSVRGGRRRDDFFSD